MKKLPTSRSALIGSALTFSTLIVLSACSGCGCDTAKAQDSGVGGGDSAGAGGAAGPVPRPAVILPERAGIPG